MTTTEAPHTRHQTASRSERHTKRPDIEGLRAVAVSLVVLYHAGLPWLPGGFVGVDVFFVISGFLITGLLVREVEASGRVDLRRFYARRAKRLLPATAVVLVATAVLTRLTVTVVEWRDFGFDIVSAALYVVNWRLAGRSVDYLAEDVGQSPVQHFWSLAVEEQYYVIWPLLLLVIAWYVRRRSGRPSRRVLAVGLAVVIVPSFVYSVLLTADDPARAFFVTPTRLWELGIGAFVAIGARRWQRLSRGPAALLGWAGLAAVGVSAVVFSSATPWPGVAAAVPTLGTAAVIVAGVGADGPGPRRLLSVTPAVWLGGLSYSLYLWHWPLLVAAESSAGGLSLTRGLAVSAFAVIPAFLSLRLVENPIRYARPLSASPGLALSVGANATAIGVVAGLVLAFTVPGGASAGGTQGVPPGAALLDSAGAAPGTVASLEGVTSFVPSAVSAPEDAPAAYAQDCQVAQASSTPIKCSWGDPGGTKTVVVVGDSKVLQYQSVFDDLGKAQHWKIVSFTKSACGFHAGMERRFKEPYTQCAAWNDAVIDDILALRPDAVITSQGSGTALARPDDITSETRGAMVEALVERWRQLTSRNIPVVVVLDNPHPDRTIYECVAEHPEELSACTFDRAAGIARSAAPAQEQAAKRVKGVSVIDPRSLICPAEQCVPVIGGVLLYRQSSHLTNTYVQTMKPALERQLVPLVNGG